MYQYILQQFEKTMNLPISSLYSHTNSMLANSGYFSIKLWVLAMKKMGLSKQMIWDKVYSRYISSIVYKDGIMYNYKRV